MGTKLHSDLERLDLSSRPFLEKSVEHMVDGIEALRQDQERAEYRKRDAERWGLAASTACRSCALTENRCAGGRHGRTGRRSYAPICAWRGAWPPWPRGGRQLSMRSNALVVWASCHHGPLARLSAG